MNLKITDTEWVKAQKAKLQSVSILYDNKENPEGYYEYCQEYQDIKGLYDDLVSKMMMYPITRDWLCSTHPEEVI